jgi:opacity protein-like surface antigen
VFGKVGVTAAHVDEPISASGLSDDATDNSTILDLGVGVSYGMANGWGFRLGFTQYHNAGSTNSTTATGQGDVNFIYVGALYRF